MVYSLDESEKQNLIGLAKQASVSSNIVSQTDSEFAQDNLTTTDSNAESYAAVVFFEKPEKETLLPRA